MLFPSYPRAHKICLASRKLSNSSRIKKTFVIGVSMKLTRGKYRAYKHTSQCKSLKLYATQHSLFRGLLGIECRLGPLHAQD